jgi:hypothetical protein
VGRGIGVTLPTVGGAMSKGWELSEQQKANAALERDERIFAVIFEPWELAWLERSGVNISDWIRSAIASRFSNHGLNFLTWEHAPLDCDLCGEKWNYRFATKPSVYDITGGFGVKVWAIGHRLYLHAECASEVRDVLDPMKSSADQLAGKMEIADRLMANLAARLGIEQG